MLNSILKTIIYDLDLFVFIFDYFNPVDEVKEHVNYINDLNILNNNHKIRYENYKSIKILNNIIKKY
tara:strand:+ start:658 stop:858 length:201 start_codon:yes stop_codon:yes gene_type:complete